MGFLDQAAASKNIPSTVLVTGFQIQCVFTVMGLLQTFLNDEQKGTFTLSNATVYGLEAGNPAASIGVDTLYVRKNECQVIAFDQTFSHEETGLMPRQEHLAAYTSHFVIQGNFHMGSDSLLSDFIESSKSMFVGLTDAYIFPLFTAQAAVIQAAPLVFIHRDSVRFHHPI
jgi:hypothetical protein